jgi:predicted ATP-grasp superfamily ATP-dependent carboligase
MNYTNPPAIILGSGGNGLGVARSLGRRGIHTIVITDKINSHEMHSRFIDKKIYFSGSDESLVEMLLTNNDLHQYSPVLFPIRDITVSAIADRLAELKKIYRIGMPDAQIIKTALSKTSFDKMALDKGFPTAKTFTVKNFAQMDEVIDQVLFPCILKPELRSNEFLNVASAKAFIANTAEELKDQYHSFAMASPEVVVQEYIPGGEEQLYFCFQYYNRDSDPVVSITGRKIRQWPPTCGSTSSCEVVDIPEIEDLSTRFFKSINYFGPCSTEFKKDPRDGKYIFIEPTIGRTDWNNSFSEGNGIPIPFVAYCDIVGLPIPNFHQKWLKYRWVRWSADYEAAVHQLKKGDLTLLDWFKSLRPPIVGPIWSLDDPVPLLRSYVFRIKRKLSKLLN